MCMGGDVAYRFILMPLRMYVCVQYVCVGKNISAL